MKIKQSTKNQNLWRISEFRKYKFRPYTLDCYEQDLRNLELNYKIHHVDHDKVFRSLVYLMVQKRIKDYENFGRC